MCASVCLSAAACPHCGTDQDITRGSGRGCPLVVHYWAGLQSVDGLRCYGNITPTQNVSEYMLVLTLCVVSVCNFPVSQCVTETHLSATLHEIILITYQKSLVKFLVLHTVFVFSVVPMHCAHFQAASQYYVDEAYCYRRSTVICLSVCRSVCHDCEVCNNGSTDRDAVWVVWTRVGL